MLCSRVQLSLSNLPRLLYFQALNSTFILCSDFILVSYYGALLQDSNKTDANVGQKKVNERSESVCKSLLTDCGIKDD